MSEETKAKSPADDASAGRERPYALPKIDFSTFVLSINSSALVQLGLIEDPSTGQKSKNIPLAKQTIDILGMLEEKTKGNLNAEEARLIHEILYELRMKFLAKKQVVKL